MGLSPDHLGKTISELKPELDKLYKEYGMNVCGEGGEYESAVFDSPIFATHKIVASDK
jgi:diphthine-ammonia ligase